MKKLTLTMALVLVMGLGAIAQEGDGLLRRGSGSRADGVDITTPSIPFQGTDANGENNGPLGSGVAVLLALGGAYFVAKKRKED